MERARRWGQLVCAVLLGGGALSSCYTPSGAFVPVESLAAGGGGGYTISPGDVLNVRVFQQESISARVRVREDGKISLPLVNDCTAEGRTPVELAAHVQAKLKEFINTPVVSVSLEESRPLSVSVVGEVARAGVFTLEPGAGVVQAIAAAGGLTELAHRDGLFVLRRRPGGAPPLRIHFRWEALVRADGKASAFRLAPGDVVVVE